MKSVNALSSLMAAVAFLSAPSHAQQLAYVSKDANLRAGPSREYPVVAILRAGVSISVAGCLSGYRWCDVTVGPDRGWVYAGNIVYPYQGAPVSVIAYGPAIGIGIVTFSLGSYWDQHYRSRPWYAQRQRWIDRPHRDFGPHDHRLPPPHPGVRPGTAPHPLQVQPRRDGQHPPQDRGHDR